MTFCQSTSETKCEKYNKIQSKRYSVSKTDCPLECVQTQYDTKINTANYPSVSYCKVLQTQENALNKFRFPNGTLAVTDSTFRSTFAKVSIYFQDSWYTQIETSLQITPEVLVGLIGTLFFEILFLTLYIVGQSRSN